LAEPNPVRDAPAGGDLAEETLSQAVERHLAAYFRKHGEDLPPPGLYDRVLKDIERPLLELSLAATRGNQIKASYLLGLNRNTLRKKIRDLEIEVIKSPKLS
jgi:two-component system nitrogen regulation response regulator GlnG